MLDYKNIAKSIKDKENFSWALVELHLNPTFEEVERILYWYKYYWYKYYRN